MTHQFKIFKGSLSNLPQIKTEMESFVDTQKIGAKSIGIEFLEGSKEIFISLGYSADGYKAISITPVNLGKVNLQDTANVEKMMSEAAGKQQNLICHELCITDQDELMMLFMSTK